MLVEKDVGSVAHLDRAFQVVAIEGDSVSLKTASPFLDKPILAHISFEDAVTKWSVFKGEIPIQVKVGHATPPEISKLEFVRMNIWKALMAAEQKTTITRSIEFWRKPDAVRAGTDFKKGELMLFPIAPLNNIVLTGSASTISLGKHNVDGMDGDVEFWLHPGIKPAPDKEGKYSEKAIWQAYWWIGAAIRQEDANMQWCHVESKGINVPCYKNNVAVKRGATLMRYVAPSKPKAASIVPKAKGAKAARKS